MQQAQLQRANFFLPCWVFFWHAGHLLLKHVTAAGMNGLSGQPSLTDTITNNKSAQICSTDVPHIHHV